MKKIINKTENYVVEMLEGIYAAYPNEICSLPDDVHCLVRKQLTKGKVGLATGGGSGHLPLFLGYVGSGLLDACAVGDVFQSPSSEQMQAVTRHIDQGRGVLYIYGNYNGDIFNFDMAAEAADFENDIRVETVVVSDDIALSSSATAQAKNARRGVAGIFFVYKCAGAAAASMLNLAEVKRIAQKAADSVKTLGVALSPCIIPRVGHASFQLLDNEIEIGMGIHGEPGLRREALITADEMADQLLDALLLEQPLEKNDHVAVLVNGLGGTPLDEQYIFFRRVSQRLSQRGVQLIKTYIGEYATAMEMAGISLSVLKLDFELENYLLAPAKTPFFIQ